jgi:hypothetical protein
MAAVAISRSAKVQLGLLVACVAFWVAILTWTVFADPGDPPGFLDDRTFPTAAEPICAEAMATVETFGSAAAVESIEERADLVDRQDEVFIALVADLRRLPRPEGEQGEWVSEWLGDWETHIRDREAWAATLHAGEDPPFEETPKGNERVSEAVDEFARVNEMPSCATFNDV